VCVDGDNIKWGVEMKFCIREDFDDIEISLDCESSDLLAIAMASLSVLLRKEEMCFDDIKEIIETDVNELASVSLSDEDLVKRILMNRLIVEQGE